MKNDLRQRITISNALAATLLTLTFTGSLAAQIPDTPFGYVTDIPGVLNDAELESLEQKLSDFEKDTSTQIFVLIATDPGGLDIFTATFETASKWGIGQSGKDNGILIALYMADQEIRIEVGYGLEGSVPDALANQIIRNTMIPHMRDGSPFLAINGAIDELIAASGNEFESGGESTHSPDAFDEYALFNDGTIPVSEEILLFLLLLAYAGVGLLYSLLAGTTARFEQETRRFRLRYDLSQVPIDFFSFQIFVGFFVSLLVGGLILLFEFVFDIPWYWVLAAGPVLGICIYGWLFLFLSYRARRNIRESLDNTAVWRKLEKRFETSAVVDIRDYFRTCLERWRPSFIYRNAVNELEVLTHKILKKPETILPYTSTFARNESQRLMQDSELWNSFRANFEVDQVDQIRKELLTRQDQIFQNADFDARAADELVKDLQTLNANPESHFEYTIVAVTALIDQMLDDTALWSKWSIRTSFDPDRVKHKRMKLHTVYALLQKQDDSPKNRMDLNDFYRNEIIPVRSRPANCFRPAEQSNAGLYGILAVTSLAAGAADGDFVGGDSGGSFDGGDFGSGGGGSFGGGGAAGGW